RSNGVANRAPDAVRGYSARGASRAAWRSVIWMVARSSTARPATEPSLIGTRSGVGETRDGSEPACAPRPVGARRRRSPQAVAVAQTDTGVLNSAELNRARHDDVKYLLKVGRRGG